MPVEASVNVVSQFAVETTPGVALAANRRFSSTNVVMTPALGTQFHRPNGSRFNEVGVLNTVSSTGSYDGIMSYTELPYILDSYIGQDGATVTQGTNARRRIYRPSVTGSDTFKTWTVQRGSAAGASSVANVAVNSLSMSFARTGVTVSGDLLGKAMDVTGTFTSSGVTTIAQRPVSGNEVCVYLDSTFGTIGTTLLPDSTSATVSLPANKQERWALNCNEASWSSLVEIAVEPTVTLVLAADSTSRALYESMATNSLPTRYLRVRSRGTLIESTFFNDIDFDAAVKLQGVTEDQDIDGSIIGYSLSFMLVNDSAFGNAYEVAVTNTIATL